MILQCYKEVWVSWETSQQMTTRLVRAFTVITCGAKNINKEYSVRNVENDYVSEDSKSDFQ